MALLGPPLHHGTPLFFERSPQSRTFEEAHRQQTGPPVQPALALGSRVDSLLVVAPLGSPRTEVIGHYPPSSKHCSPVDAHSGGRMTLVVEVTVPAGLFRYLSRAPLKLAIGPLQIVSVL